MRIKWGPHKAECEITVANYLDQRKGSTTNNFAVTVWRARDKNIDKLEKQNGAVQLAKALTSPRDVSKW
jgi:hypothetical protein